HCGTARAETMFQEFTREPPFGPDTPSGPRTDRGEGRPHGRPGTLRRGESMSLWFARATRTVSVLALALTVAFGLAATVSAQGLQTSTLTGTASASDGSALPGATVTLSSPALQGDRSTTTDANGNYVFRGLPT